MTMYPSFPRTVLVYACSPGKNIKSKAFTLKVSQLEQ